jgi:hypothetical protein
MITSRADQCSKNRPPVGEKRLRPRYRAMEVELQTRHLLLISALRPMRITGEDQDSNDRKVLGFILRLLRHSAEQAGLKMTDIVQL